MSEVIKSLASNIVERKKAGLDPYVLFLGAGASINSGCSSMLHIVDDVLRSRDATQLEAWQKEISDATAVDLRYGDLLRNEINKKKLARFHEVWAALDIDTRYSILRKHLWVDKMPSEGYSDLAHLVKAQYFNIILSTNLDNLIEKALGKAGLLAPENFIVVVNGKDSPEEVKDQLESARTPVKLVKLHGSLESPRSYAFTAEEVFNFEKTIKPSLTRIVNQSLLIVGHNMQDRDINVLFEDECKEIHFINPARPEVGSSIDNVVKVRGLGSIIDGSDGTFDKFFRKLRTAIELVTGPHSTASSLLPIDGFLQSIGYEGELKAPRSRYKNLQTLYVKPTEYEDILTKLEQEHVLFIIGEPHMGKTYTALYLLWEYYQKGYETLHIRHDELINRLHRHDGNLKALLLELFSPVSIRPRIIHFDDPFGETLERRTETFANGLDTLLDMAGDYEHLRVVVTSRLNIFNEATAENVIQGNLAELEKTLRVHTSYRREVLLDILRRYVQFYKPLWAVDQRILDEIEEKLPDLLPAPHNIEFFVSTSGTLNTINAVLAHVEESKKMISALASWMKNMPPHEQIFLMWVEVCSAASILFPGAPASEINIEKAFNRTLASLFEEGHISGIPPMPFSTARDKFETILLERRDEVSRTLRLDFVHPSYHEAFWYAVNRNYPIAQWWELISKNVAQILRDLVKSIDVVQLKMVKSYGTINRDLDQLLLLSAESENVNEQLVALGHMLERPEKFMLLPQFSACMSSVISHKDEPTLLALLDLYEKHFNQLPLPMISLGLSLLYNEHTRVRIKAQDVLEGRIDELPEPIRQEELVKQWRVLSKLVSVLSDENKDWLNLIIGVRFQGSDVKGKLKDKLLGLIPQEIQQLMRVQKTGVREAVFWLIDYSWDELSNEQKESIFEDEYFEAQGSDLQLSILHLAADHLSGLVSLNVNYIVINDLVKLQQAFNVPLDTDILSSFKKLPPDQWPPLSLQSLRELVSLNVSHVGRYVTERLLESYKQIPSEYRDVYVETLYSPSPVNSLINYISWNRYDFEKLSNDVLMKLLNAPGKIQYEVLTSLLVKLDSLTEERRKVICALIDNPPDLWVGASIGQTGWKKFEGKLSKGIEDILSRIINHNQKRYLGGVLAEMAQCYLDDTFGLQEQYVPLLKQFIKDSEIMAYAEDWMDYLYKVYGFYNEEYWSGIKSRLRNLPERILENPLN